MNNRARKILHKVDGATAIEYALICAFIVLAVAVALPLLGISVQGLFQNVTGAFVG